jgi:5-hydroxyisourate hydrolase-like protein (transthyretin family)
MFIKPFRIGFIGLILLATSAWAATSAIQGVVTDAKGKPIKGADVRIEARNGGKLFKTVKTDANGRYVSDGLAAGVYRVTLIVNGTVKASINDAKTKAAGPTQLNFDLKPTSTSQASGSAKKGKQWVWVPPKTGTHTGGGWVEVDDNATSAGADSVQTVHGSTLQTEHANPPAPPPVGR